MNKDNERISDFLFEIGVLRKTDRAHKQVLFTDDSSDNIASHSYRVTMISWFLAKKENADPYKTVMMALLHDTDEVRSNDHHWVQKKYVKVFEKEIAEDQLGTLPFGDLLELSDEYEERETLESKIVKDADMLDQVLLLREYAWAGNREAERWLGKEGEGYVATTYEKEFKTDSAREIFKILLHKRPSEWYGNNWTNKRR